MKYSLLHRQIPEIPALKLDIDKSELVVIHRTSRCIVCFDKEKKPKSASKPLRNSFGDIVEVGKIYEEISRSFFDESHNFGSVKLKDEQIHSKKNQSVKDTLNIQNKLKSMSAVHDSHIKDIKSRILFTNRKIKHSRAGNSTESQQVTKDSSASLIIANNESSSNRTHRKKLIDSHRNLTFEQKLEFYDENPVLAERRIRTSHLPWDKPEVPNLTTTPENSKFFNKKETVQEEKSRNVLRFNHKDSIRLDYLKNPALLGRDGGKLLLQIIKDERYNVGASQDDIVEINRIIKRRIRRMNERKKGWKEEIFRYAVNKVNLEPTCAPGELINSYFNYMWSGLVEYE